MSRPGKEHRVRHRALRWLTRANGIESGEVYLHRQRVYILPTRAGMTFGITLLVMFLGTVNYNLGLGFGFTFLLASCALIDMHLTFRNLAHLHLSAGRATPVFAGEEARFELFLADRRGRARHAIWLDFAANEQEERAHAVDVAANTACSVTLSTHASQRGWLQAPRVRLQTRFPLGLMRAWSYWQPDVQVLVYPRPEEDAPPLPLETSDRSDGRGLAGHEDFAGIRSYQPGDSPRHLAWRQIARTDGAAMVSKHFEGGATTELVLDMSRLPFDLDTEARLSRLTRWVIEAEARGVPYALLLGDTRFPASLGPTHQAACLHALAIYGGA